VKHGRTGIYDQLSVQVKQICRLTKHATVVAVVDVAAVVDVLFCAVPCCAVLCCAVLCTIGS
jgi:hypothetical protein